MTELSPEQLLAVDAARRERLLIITGGPGRGKTTLIRELIRLDEDILLVAPTGAAAEQLTRSTGRVAHVLDKIEFSNELLRTYHGKPVVGDEISMLPTWALVHLLSFLKPSKLILVGDPQQLPPPQGGEFSTLASLIAYGKIPTVKLTTNFRRDTTVNNHLNTVIESMGTPGFQLPGQGDDSLQIVYTQTPVEEAAKLYRSKPCQMLTFTNGMVDKLIAATESSAEVIRAGVRVGDRVVCTKNLYIDGPLCVANGSMGWVSENGNVLYQNGFVDVLYRKQYKSQFVSSRAMTVHKSQGNEFAEHGIIVCTGWFGVLGAEMMYTALTRFRGNVTILGTSQHIRNAFAGTYQPRIDRELVYRLHEAAKDHSHDGRRTLEEPHANKKTCTE